MSILVDKNTRLICHLPLIVPDDCRLRVGNEVRGVVPDELMIFDDSIEHEAWNDSREVRVVLEHLGLSVNRLIRTAYGPFTLGGSAVGAGARYLVARALVSPDLPLGTLSVNVVGGLLMGLLAGWLARVSAGEPARLLLGVGVLGGFTTFSAFSLDVVTLMERGDIALALGYVLVERNTDAVLALFAGLWLVRAVA